MNSIETFAAALAEAESNRDAIRAELIVRETALREVVDRLTALDTERQKILASSPVDSAGLLTINAADQEDLQPILVEHQSAAGAKHDELILAERAVSVATQHLARAGDREYLDRVVAHAAELDRLLLATLAELIACSTRLGVGGRPAWAPSRGLADQVRRLDLQREA